MGWIGKNTCLIHPRLGSFFLLAEILMDSQPQPDSPQSDHCGTCRRCLDACPTQAFPSPGVLDANRCLVTWNIEMRGETPRQFWPQQGQWAAGCDICQTVCPYNSASQTPADDVGKARAPDSELATPLPWQSRTLADCIRMTPAEFDRDFQASTLRRTGVKGLRLGAITAAGNVSAENCRPALEACLRDSDADIRSRARWALEQLQNAVTAGAIQSLSDEDELKSARSE